MYIFFISVLALLTVAYATACLYMYLYQDKLLYIPERELNTDPASLGLEFSEHWIKTSDGERLHAWYIPCQDARYTFLFFHGNTGNLSTRMDTINILHELGINLFMIDYRGYGKSTGKPSEQGTYLDGEASWQYLIHTLGIRPEKAIIFGRSLGGGIASHLATRVTPAGLILESTFSSMCAVAKDVYPLIPVRLILHTRYPNIDNIRQINCPLLIIHSTEDEYIGFHHGQALYNAFNPRVDPSYKHFVPIAGAHNSGFFTSAGQYKQGINEFMALLDHCAATETIEQDAAVHEQSAISPQ